MVDITEPTFSSIDRNQQTFSRKSNIKCYNGLGLKGSHLLGVNRRVRCCRYSITNNNNWDYITKRSWFWLQFESTQCVTVVNFSDI